MLRKLKSLASWAWSFLGDPKTKNALIVILIVMSGFGVIAPEKATHLRDLVLSMAF